jgi:uncharacterized membrane protein
MIQSIYQTLGNIGYHHPLHPTIIHLPIGLVMGAVVFAVLGWISRGESLARSARYCMRLALAALPVAALLGYMDWQHFYSGSWMAPIKAKLVLSGILALLLLIAAFAGRGKDRCDMKTVGLYLLCLVAVVGIGYFGGELVYGAKAAKAAPAQQLAQEGAPVFGQKCAFCHHSDSTATKVGPGLKGLFARDKLPFSQQPVSEENIRRLLETPFKNMPPITDLNEEQTRALIAYLKTL